MGFFIQLCIHYCPMGPFHLRYSVIVSDTGGNHRGSHKSIWNSPEQPAPQTDRQPPPAPPATTAVH